jgi:hypothetical protein
MNITTQNRKALLDASMEVGLDVTEHGTKCMFMLVARTEHNMTIRSYLKLFGKDNNKTKILVIFTNEIRSD